MAGSGVNRAALNEVGKNSVHGSFPIVVELRLDAAVVVVYLI